MHACLLQLHLPDGYRCSRRHSTGHWQRHSLTDATTAATQWQQTTCSKQIVRDVQRHQAEFGDAPSDGSIGLYARGPLEAFVAGCIYGPERSVCVTCQGIWDAHARRTISAASFDADVCLSASLSFFVVRVVVFRVIGRTLFSYMSKQQRHHAHPGAICWTRRDSDATRPCASRPL